MLVRQQKVLVMVSSRLSVRIPPGLLRHFEAYLDQHDLTVSEGVIAAIASYVGDGKRRPLIERVSQLEKRLAQLEGKV